MKNPSFAGDEVALICPVVSFETRALDALGAVMVRLVVTVPIDNRRADCGPISLTPDQCRELATELLARANGEPVTRKAQLN